MFNRYKVNSADIQALFAPKGREGVVGSSKRVAGRKMTELEAREIAAPRKKVSISEHPAYKNKKESKLRVVLDFLKG